MLEVIGYLLTLYIYISNCRLWKCDIKGAQDGTLKGKTIAIKDNCCVAGVPMTNGSVIMEGYTPEVDATIVTRILDAGTVIGVCISHNLDRAG